MDTSLINRDLARWSRRQWFWSVAFFLTVEFSIFYYITQPVRVPSDSPAQPKLHFTEVARSKPLAEWLELEDPMLLASPNWHGVSGLAWMRKPPVEFALHRDFPAVRYLPFRETSRWNPARETTPPDRPFPTFRPNPGPTLPVLPPPSLPPGSKLRIEGFADRGPLALPSLPPEYYNDAVGATVVEAGIDPYGVILSARVIDSSGSKKADSDALGITRGLRFEPLRSFREAAPEIVWGKLIFQWHALDLTRTNAVQR